MKVRDGLYYYPGTGGRPATTHLRVYRHEDSTVAIVGELADNPSTSITNAARVVCRQLRDEYGPDVIVIEYYPGSKVTWSTVISPAGHEPEWGPLSFEEVQILVGEPVQLWAEANYTTAAFDGPGPSLAE